MIRTMLRGTAWVALIVFVLIWPILFMAGLPDNRLAVVQDDAMEPTVPQGAVMIIPGGDEHELGDVVAWWPHPYDAYWREGPAAVFGIFDYARAARVAPRVGDTRMFTFDNRPDDPPLSAVGGRVRAPMSGYIPFLGYLLWPGPIGLVLIVAAAALVLFVTRKRRGPTTG